MEVTFEINDDKKIVIVRVSGTMTIRDISPVTIEARSRARELNYNLLYDFRNSTYKTAIVDAYKYFEDHYDSSDPEVNYIPTAHIINKEDEEFFKFVETTLYNRGARVKYFMEESEGMDWLVSLK